MHRFIANHGDSELNDVDADGQTALLMAMEHGDHGVKIIELLCDAGADINQMNFRKKTPLHVACMNQNHLQVCDSWSIYVALIFIYLNIEHSSFSFP